MNAMEQMQEGLRILDAHGITPEQYSRVARIVHPKIENASQQEMLAGTWALTWSETQEPLTIDNVAKQLADNHGAYPWDGPVGNGLTREYYRAKFREMADEHLFAWLQLGLIEGSDS